MAEIDHRQIDPRLEESEERYRAVIENASDMIQSVRPDGTFEFVNKAWLSTLGYAPEEVANLIVWDVIHPDEYDHCGPYFERAVQGEPIGYMQTTFVTRDKRSIPVEGNVTSRFLGDKVVATHGFFRDVTERNRAQELEARNVQLEREHQARYLEKMAALGKLSAGLAHELNNPAAAIQRASAGLGESLTQRDAAVRLLAEADPGDIGWRELAALLQEIDTSNRGDDAHDPLETSNREMAVEEWLDDHDVEDGWRLAPALVGAGVDDARLERLSDCIPTQSLGTALGWITETLAIHEAVDIIVRSSRRISELVASVKGYSYMDRATAQVVDIHEGVDSTLIILGHRLRDVKVTKDFQRDLPMVQVFGNTLNQVWTNILDNAIDATDGTGTISIRTRRDEDAIVVEIEDNGHGIPPEDLACIFEPFFTTKPQGAGTGLGLDTAWRIVSEEHGGTIVAESEPGRTTFRVSIPIESGAGSSTGVEGDT